MKFKQRSSTDILLIRFWETEGQTVAELTINAKRRGELAIEDHWIVQKDGSVEQGRESYVVGHYSVESPEQTLTIRVDAKSEKDLSDAQAYALAMLLDSLKGEYKEAEVCYE